MASSSQQLKKKNSALTFLRDVLVIVAIAVIGSLVIKTFFVRSFFIPSGSMEDSLLIGDHIMVNEIGPRIGGLSRGDVVVFEDPGGWLEQAPAAEPPNPLLWGLEQIGLAPASGDEYLVKRVIGLPGDRVACCDAAGNIKVNGAPISESYVKVPPGAPASSTDFDVTVPKGHLWVMGDNRYNSADSRAHASGPTHGFVPIDHVVGVAFAVTWPLNRLSFLANHGDAFERAKRS